MKYLLSDKNKFIEIYFKSGKSIVINADFFEFLGELEKYDEYTMMTCKQVTSVFIDEVHNVITRDCGFRVDEIETVLELTAQVLKDSPLFEGVRESKNTDSHHWVKL